MKKVKFEWNEDKNRKNIGKHDGIDFEEAASVFYDENAIVFDDPDHSEGEYRFLIIGFSKKNNLCIVSHCYRGKNDEIIRIISARKATSKEKSFYIKYNGGKGL